MSGTPNWYNYTLMVLGVQLNPEPADGVIVGYEGYILLVCLIQKLIYFVNISHNPMNSDPEYTTSCRDPLLKNARSVINLFLEPKNEVYT